MTWLFLSLIAPLFWTWNNLIDQFLVRKYCKGNSSLAMFMGSLAYPIPLCVIALFYPTVLEIPVTQIFILTGLGSFLVLSFIPYFKALETDDSSIIVAVFQTIPVFVFVLAWLFLGETVSLIVLAGASIVILTSIAICYDFDLKTIKHRALLLIGLCSILIAIHALLSRTLLLEMDWKIVSYWLAVGSSSTGFAALCLLKRFRVTLKSLIIETKGRILLISFSQELVYYSGVMCWVAALSKAPAAGLVHSVMAIQPVYALIGSGIFALFLPHMYDKFNLGRIFWYRMACILMIIFGIYLIYEN